MRFADTQAFLKNNAKACALLAVLLLVIPYNNCTSGLSVSLLTGSANQSSGTETGNLNSFNVGINLPWITYWNNTAMYADVMMQSSGNNGQWDDNAAMGAAAPVDSTGAPTVPATTMFSSNYPSGQYTVTWDGTGTLKFGSPNVLGAVTSVVLNGIQHNTATLTMVQNLTPMSSPSVANFASITATPPVTDIHVQAPPNLTSPDGFFIQNFLDRMRPFTTLRFMWALWTPGIGFSNGNKVSNWSDRTWPSTGSRYQPQGMAYEDIIALANATGKDIWINIPVLATDDYVCRLARLLHFGEPGDGSNSTCNPSAPSAAPIGAVGLNSNIKVYVELSNEIWNTGYQETTDLYCMANGAPPSGHTCSVTAPTSTLAKSALTSNAVPWDSPSIGNYQVNRGNEMGLILTKRNNDIFKSVFGSQFAQVKTIINVQSAWPAEIDPAFSFMKKAYGSVSASIDYMAVAPYFNTSVNSSVSSLLTDLNSNILSSTNFTNSSSIGNWLTADLAEAKAYGLPLIAYEGGQGLGASAAAQAAQFDPGMYTATLQFFSLWDKLVGRKSLFTYYTFNGTYGSSGYWGALVNQYDAGSQKWDALMSLILLPGDANGDGRVDQTDCAILKANYGKPGKWWSQGQFTHNATGTVDAADLSVLNANIIGPACVAGP